MNEITLTCLRITARSWSWLGVCVTCSYYTAEPVSWPGHVDIPQLDPGAACDPPGPHCRAAGSSTAGSVCLDTSQLAALCCNALPVIVETTHASQYSLFSQLSWALRVPNCGLASKNFACCFVCCIDIYVRLLRIWI
jgi:hypothetical protein